MVMKWLVFSGLLLLPALRVTPAPANSEDQWATFIDRPSDTNFQALMRQRDGDKCAAKYIPNASQRALLFKLISLGNERAFRLGLHFADCIDGGDSEDLYRSSGEFFELHPRRFLLFTKDQLADGPSKGKYMLTMLPLDTVDDINAQLNRIRLRSGILRKINDASLHQQVRLAELILLKADQDLSRIKQQMTAPITNGGR